MIRHEAFREQLHSPVLMHAMAAHNPLAAKLAEQAGFHAIWVAASSLPPATRCPMPTSCRCPRTWR